MSEGLYGSWLSNSFLLMTMSLLFYHMTKMQSLEMDRRVASLFAVALVLVSIVMGISGILPYFQRVGSIIRKTKDREEENFRALHVTLGIIVILIQIGIAVTIVLGTFVNPTVLVK